jgi:transcriptional regulator with XRE-family HTH domain
MKGEELRKRLKDTSFSMTEIANRLGVLPQNLYSAFNADDVNSGLLEKLSDVLGIPISYFYGDSYNVTGNNNATGNNNTVNASDDRLLQLLLNKDEQLTMAMKQTSKAQEQMDLVLQGMKGKHII